MKSKRAVIYCRVATQQVDRPEDSIQFQMNKAEAFAKKRGYAIVKQYIDSPSSGLRSGASMKLLLEDAAKGIFDIVLVKDEFRLARSATLFFEIMEALKESKVRVIFLDYPACSKSHIQSLQWGFTRRTGRPTSLDFI